MDVLHLWRVMPSRLWVVHHLLLALLRPPWAVDLSLGPRGVHALLPKPLLHQPWARSRRWALKSTSMRNRTRVGDQASLARGPLLEASPRLEANRSLPRPSVGSPSLRLMWAAGLPRLQPLYLLPRQQAFHCLRLWWVANLSHPRMPVARHRQHLRVLAVLPRPRVYLYPHLR